MKITNNSYKLMKVFNCQWDPGMPDDVKDAFFSFYECGNDVYVTWTVQDDDTGYDDNDPRSVSRRLVDDWLIDNGAVGRTPESPYHGETVLIKHWW